MEIRVEDYAKSVTADLSRNRPKKLSTVCMHRGETIDGEVFPPRKGLGDFLADRFASIGITKEKWGELTGKFTKENKKGGCSSCAWRHKFSNWVGSSLGLSSGRGPELNEIIEVEQLNKIEPRSVYECSKHGKCIPYNISKNLSIAIKNDLNITCCKHCPDYCVKEPEKVIVATQKVREYINGHK